MGVKYFERTLNVDVQPDSGRASPSLISMAMTTSVSNSGTSTSESSPERDLDSSVFAGKKLSPDSYSPDEPSSKGAIAFKDLLMPETKFNKKGTSFFDVASVPKSASAPSSTFKSKKVPFGRPSSPIRKAQTRPAMENPSRPFSLSATPPPPPAQQQTHFLPSSIALNNNSINLNKVPQVGLAPSSFRIDKRRDTSSSPPPHLFQPQPQQITLRQFTSPGQQMQRPSPSFNNGNGSANGQLQQLQLQQYQQLQQMAIQNNVGGMPIWAGAPIDQPQPDWINPVTPTQQMQRVPSSGSLYNHVLQPITPQPMQRVPSLGNVHITPSFFRAGSGAGGVADQGAPGAAGSPKFVPLAANGTTNQYSYVNGNGSAAPQSLSNSILPHHHNHHHAGTSGYIPRGVSRDRLQVSINTPPANPDKFDNDNSNPNGNNNHITQSNEISMANWDPYRSQDPVSPKYEPRPGSVRATPSSTDEVRPDWILPPSCEKVDRYSKIHRLGEGTYSTVYKAKDNVTGETVAIKKTKELGREGVDLTTLREVRLLQVCRPCANIVNLKQVCMSAERGIYMVLEYAPYDLSLIVRRMTEPFSMGKIKCIVHQLLQGIHFMHSNGLMHRDIKTPNLLLTEDGILKLADFGLARIFRGIDSRFTRTVVTLWYRAPEVLFQDIWSVGTIFAELVLNRPLLPGRSELDQIEKTISLLGSPHDSWPDFEKLPLASTIKLPKLPATSQLHSIFNRHLSPVGLDFLNKMMSYDPNKRLSAEEALAHPFWEEKPRAVAPSTLLRGINAKLRKGITLEQIRDDPR